MIFEDLKTLVKEKLNLDFSKTVKCNDFIKNIGFTTGAGMSLIHYVKADCFLTGDIKYHDAMEAKIRKISLIDIGHWESERHFSSLLMEFLEKYLLNNKIKAIITTSKNPFNYK
jgi:putative NIF3 family GTP cyclohydrolase 1 type 2